MNEETKISFISIGGLILMCLVVISVAFLIENRVEKVTQKCNVLKNSNDCMYEECRANMWSSKYNKIEYAECEMNNGWREK